jgi:DNA mismatch endonuclease (patch repair protein)
MDGFENIYVKLYGLPMAGHSGPPRQSRAERVHLRTRAMPTRSKSAPNAKDYPSHRSWTMAQVKSKNTTPELNVRKAAHALGLRFRLHRADLPGKPDLVFPRRRTALFVHGCFWHSHSNCGRARVPKTNVAYWTKKLARNTHRDREAIKSLRKAGWRCTVIWECQTNDRAKLDKILSRLFLPVRRS